MRPRRTPRSNVVFHLPGGTEDNDCWARRGTVELPGDPCDGDPLIEVVFELDDEERAAIAAGANVVLGVASTEFPPVILGVTDEELGAGRNDG